MPKLREGLARGAFSTEPTGTALGSSAERVSKAHTGSRGTDWPACHFLSISDPDPKATGRRRQRQDGLGSWLAADTQRTASGF